MIAKYPFVGGMRPFMTIPWNLPAEQHVAAGAAITGAAGLPLPGDGGNVLRPQTTPKLSPRLLPTGMRSVRRIVSGSCSRRIRRTGRASRTTWRRR